MTFLAPTTLAIAAAITVPLLLALYMLRLRRRPVRVSAVQFWPRASQDLQANVPLRWIRPSLLLFLHLAILALFLAALGRPAIKSSSGIGGRAIIVLDISASMGARDVQGTRDTLTRLEAAQARAIELTDAILGSGSVGGEVSVVAFASEPRVLAGFGASRRAVRSAIEGATQTDEPGNLAAALRVVEAMASDGSDESQAAATAILISDGSFASTGEALRAAPRVRFERIGPSDASVPNVGIVALSASRDAEDPALVRVFVDVLNTANEPASVPLTLSLDGQVIEREALALPAASSNGQPGRTTITLPIQAPTGGVVLANLSTTLLRDALASDNAAGLTLDPPARPVIWLVTRSGMSASSPAPADAAPATSAGDAFLAKALEELRPQRLDVITEGELARRLSDRRDREASLIILSSARTPFLPAAPTLSFGIVPPNLGITIDGENEGARTAFWDREHPMLRNVSLDSLVVARSLRLATPNPDAAPSASQNTPRIIARGGSGPLIVLADAGGFRHAAVLFELEQSNWPILLGFPIFLSDAVDFLTLRGESTSGRWVRTGEPASLRLAPGTTSAPTRVVLEGPERREIEVAPATTSTQGSAPVATSSTPPSGTASEVAGVPVGVFSRAGIYLVRGSGLVDRAIAVNVANATESALASPQTLAIGTRRVESTAGLLPPREIWWWCVLLAGVLLLIEWLVYAWQARA